jgi:hypothetical protein
MRIHDHGLRRIHITTNLMFAAANGAGFLLTELAWAPLTPSSRSACCYRTASINLPSTFRVENKRILVPGLRSIPKASNLNEILAPYAYRIFSWQSPKTLTRYHEHVIPIFDEHMMASWIPTRISLIPRRNFARDTRSSKSPKIDIP